MNKPIKSTVRKAEQNILAEITQRKKIGNVTIEERNEIQSLFERKNGLTELFKSLTADNSFLYDKIIQDMGIVSVKFQKWWDDKSKKYNWENIPGYKWEINFQTCEIFLFRE